MSYNCFLSYFITVLLSCVTVLDKRNNEHKVGYNIAGTDTSVVILQFFLKKNGWYTNYSLHPVETKYLLEANLFFTIDAPTAIQGIPALYETRRFIAGFIRACCLPYTEPEGSSLYPCLSFFKGPLSYCPRIYT